MDRRAWPRRDPRWIPPAAIAAVLVVLGVLVVAVMSGLGAALAGEATFGGAAAAVVVTGVSLRRAWIGRADDDVTDPPAATPSLAVLTGYGANAAITPADAIATIDRATGPGSGGAGGLATLHLHGWGGDSGPRTPITVTAQISGETLDLEHRRGEPADAEHPGEAPPDLVLRLVDRRGRARAGAHVHRHGPVEDWSVPINGHLLRFRVDPRRRPHRRTLLDTTRHLDAGTRRVYPLQITRPTRRLTFDPPQHLSPEGVVLCLWLGHLLDAHARAGRRWEAPDPEWTALDQDFPVRTGPGGFGDPFPRSSGASGPGGGGGS